MVDYARSGDDGVGGHNKWKDVEAWLLIQGLKEAMAWELNKRVINLYNREDSIIWCGVASREYSAKLGYQLQIAQGEKKSWMVVLC